MKVLIFGPSGSGKTYISGALWDLGINAFDADDIDGLSDWYNKDGQKVTQPKTAEEAMNNHYSFLWNKNFLSDFLSRFTEVYLFGGSGNIWDMFELFDKVYFLHIDFYTQMHRIMNSSDRDKLMDFNENELIVWGEWFEQEAKRWNIPFIDATLSPKEIFDIIKNEK